MYPNTAAIRINAAATSNGLRAVFMSGAYNERTHGGVLQGHTGQVGMERFQ
jgi:hypothetical protein